MKEKIERASDNLARKLDWISRYDTKAYYIGGISIAMLGVLSATSMDLLVTQQCPNSIAPDLAGLLLFLSLFFLFLGQYPAVKAPSESLLYFGSISNMKLNEFSKRFKNISDEDYLDDLLSQVYTNAKILNRKFFYLRVALILLLLSIIPWLAAIYLGNTPPV